MTTAYSWLLLCAMLALRHAPCVIATPCDAGKYASGVQCFSCNSGQYMSENSHSHFSCKNCPTGWQSSTNKASCASTGSCGAGKFKQSAFSTQCNDCQSGQYMSETSHTNTIANNVHPAIRVRVVPHHAPRTHRAALPESTRLPMGKPNAMHAMPRGRKRRLGRLGRIRHACSDSMKTSLGRGDSTSASTQKRAPQHAKYAVPESTVQQTLLPSVSHVQLESTGNFGRVRESSRWTTKRDQSLRKFFQI